MQKRFVIFIYLFSNSLNIFLLYLVFYVLFNLFACVVYRGCIGKHIPLRSCLPVLSSAEVFHSAFEYLLVVVAVYVHGSAF